MSVFMIISLLGGLAIFLFGMNILGEGLEKYSGGSLSKILSNLTASPFRGLLLGIGITAVIQSSSATSVMVVGFVNSGVLTFEQSIGVIMGANIGTTVTSWLLALTGIEGDVWYLEILKPSTFSPIIAFIGLILYMKKSQRKRDIGYLMVAFAILMTGMEMMSDAVKPLAEVPQFNQLFTLFKNPFLGVLVGALVTAIIQSSSASIGILQALSATGSVSFAAAVPIILGQNIGTCVTAIISSVGANKAAKRVSAVHLCFNVIGAAFFMAAFYSVNFFFPLKFMNDPISTAQIAIVHSVFNVSVTLVLFPLNRMIARLACLIVPDAKDKETKELLDERFLSTPSVAVEQCRKATLDMAHCVQDALSLSLSLFKKYDEKTAQKILALEDKTDNYEDKLGTYLVKLSERPLTLADSHRVSLILHAIGDWERIGDHCVNLLDSAKEMKTKGIVFSEDACGDIDVIEAALREVLSRTVAAFESEDYHMAMHIEPLEDVIDHLRYQLKERHIARLKKGNCGIETGFVFSDMLTNIERISDHCANIAVAMIEIAASSFGRHEYKNSKYSSEQFEREYESFSEKYSLKGGFD